MHLPPPREPYGDDLGFPIYPVHMAPASLPVPSLYDPLDDVFGPDPESSVHGPPAPVPDNHDMTLDTRRLQAQHTTTGYREGITAGKAASIQGGFDEGFTLGANIGLKAGALLGVLEGISTALAETGPTEESVRANRLLSQAALDLSLESIFTPEFWAPNGDVRYSVEASYRNGEVTNQDVADQHPLILKWNRIVCNEASIWHLDQLLPILGNNDTSTQEDLTPAAPIKPNTPSRSDIDW
ncbi:hypothetical protein F5Y19DRAFT_419790 [Xylariaceae sp. FL1651]|nr:hypothetical protein F5Y19DRAFT_419790 [Xylariaceae sp. FL1651]